MDLTQHQRDLFGALSNAEFDLLVGLVNAVHAMKYGSVTLTIHDGELVEIHRTERIRVQK
jgi:hypothetical protein